MDKSLFNDNGYKKQIITFAVIFLFIILLIIVLIFNNNKDDYIIINKSLVLTKNGFKYNQIKKLDDNFFDREYNVYSNGKLYTQISIKVKDNIWYYFDKDYNDLNLNMVPVAYTDKFKKLKVADFDYNYYDTSDDNYISKVIGNRDITNFKDSLSKSSFDLDGDGMLEHIYTITNVSLSGDKSGNYSSIFLVKGDTFIGELSKDHKSPYLVQGIMDLDGDGKYEVIVSKGTIDGATFDTCYQIYSIKGKKIKLIKDC